MSAITFDIGKCRATMDLKAQICHESGYHEAEQ